MKKPNLSARRICGVGWEAELHIDNCIYLPSGYKQSGLELLPLRKSSSAASTKSTRDEG